MFDVRDALTELTGVLSRGAQPGEVINIARSYGREMYVLTILQRTGDAKPITLSVLSTVWNRLKGKGGTTFGRLAAKLWKEAPTIVDYGETNKKKATAYCVKLKGLMAFAPEWEYDGQDGMTSVKDYQRIPTAGWTATVAVGSGRHTCPSSRTRRRRQRPHATACRCRSKRRRGKNRCG